MNPQEQLARILVRTDLAEHLRADPEGFARAHGADPAMSRRLSGLPPAGLSLASAVIRDVRARRITEMFPAAFALAGPSGGRLLRAVEECGVLTGVGAVADLTGRLTSEAVRTDAARAGLLADVIGYEGLCHRARFLASGPERLTPRPGRPEPAHGVLPAFFRRHVAETHRLILTGRPLPGSPAVPTHYALRAAAGSDLVRSHRLPPALGRVLAACDGERAAAAVAHEADLTVPDALRALAVLAGSGLLARPEPPEGN